MRILIVKLSSIGDIIHTLPALAAIRRTVPEARISWVAERRSAEILRENRLIDRLIEIDTRGLRGGNIIENILLDASKQISEIRSERYDLAIDFQGLLKSAAIAKLSRADKRFGFGRSDLREPAARIFYSETGEVPGGQIHVIRKNLALAGFALQTSLTDADLEFPITTNDRYREEAEILIEQIGQPNFALLNPGGGWVTKLWHPEKFGQLADRLWKELRLPSIIAVGPNENALAVQANASNDSRMSTIAKPTLKGFYELAKRAAIYVGGDTGPTHLAVAAGAPVVGLFGPTEWWRNGSLNADDVCVERTDISCRIGCHRRTCSNWICMDSDVDAAFASVEARLKKAASPLEAVISFK